MYQAAADGCAAAVVRVPALEAPFTRIGALVWSRPGIGRFYQSAAHRVAARLRASGRSFKTLTVAGVPIVLDAAEFTTIGLYFGGDVYEAATTAFFARALAPGSVFVDVGANHGYFSMLAAALVGERGRVVSFEPNPAVFEQLQTHVRLNHFEHRVAAHQIALADEPDPAARFFVSQSAVNSGLSSLTPPEETLKTGQLSGAHTIAVRVDTFDHWFRTSELTRVDLLKIDVEGGEAQVVGGMQASLAGGVIAQIILETVWDSPAHRAVCAAGYEARVLDRVGPLSNVLYTRTAA
jgi:FkbM family methyltransferase